MELRIRKIEHKHIYDTVIKMFEFVRPQFSYSIPNLKTFAVTGHPAFQIWLCASHFAGLGGDVTKLNAIEELFGSSEFNEGNHAQLCKNYISRLGTLNLKTLQSAQNH